MLVCLGLRPIRTRSPDRAARAYPHPAQGGGLSGLPSVPKGEYDPFGAAILRTSISGRRGMALHGSLNRARAGHVIAFRAGASERGPWSYERDMAGPRTSPHDRVLTTLTMSIAAGPAGCAMSA